ncbi:hypothetical protein [Roseovarius sp. SYSU LYC5161]|uniref:hypothetical protein n=1 Tax=Roseovarius halophilus (ex Wu et al. 2025) TaxID=3376060 RepID=UPI003999FD66
MKTITTIQYDPDDPDDLQALRESEHRRLKMGPVLWDRVAAHYQEILENAGLVPLGIEGREYTCEEIDAWKGIKEHHLEAIAAEYLKIYQYFQIKLEKLEGGNLQEWHFLFDDLFEMGQIYERQFWRAGVDPQTGECREQLALERQHSRKQFAEVSEGRSAANAKRHEEAVKLTDIAQDIAEKYWRRKPNATKLEVAKHVVKKWPDKETCGIHKPSESTVRQRIAKT